MINNPWETQSDSFYFVDVMVMHNKAEVRVHAVRLLERPELM